MEMTEPTHDGNTSNTSTPPGLGAYDDLVYDPDLLRTSIDSNNTTDPSVETVEDWFNYSADKAVAGLMIFFLVVAILGNTLSLIYFSKKGKLTLPSFLYVVIGSFDICISLISIPVIASLINSRSEALFQNNIICASWPTLFYFLKRMSMFLIMMMSVTRSIVTSFPFLVIRIKDVLIATIIYSTTIIIVDSIYLSMDGYLRTQYGKKQSSCENYFTKHPASKLYSVLLQMELVVPCIIVVISFLLCLKSLVKVTTEYKTDEIKKFRKVSITISIFVGVFLVCNMPAFLLQLDYLARYVKGDDKGFNSGSFMDLYSHILSHFFLTFCNSAINSCLYLLRMPYYRQWIKLILKDPRMVFISARMTRRSVTTSQWSSCHAPPRSSFRSGSTVVRTTRNGSVVGSTRYSAGSQRRPNVSVHRQHLTVQQPDDQN